MPKTKQSAVMLYAKPNNQVQETSMLYIGDPIQRPSEINLQPYGAWWYDWGYDHHIYVHPQRSKFDQAFKVVSKLIAKNYLADLTVKQFIALINEVAEEL